MLKNSEGGCMCRAIRYVLNSEPLVVYYCHCNDCKKSTGSAFHVGLVMKEADVEISSGKTKSFTKSADSGNQMTRYFCEHCGSLCLQKIAAHWKILSSRQAASIT